MSYLYDTAPGYMATNYVPPAHPHTYGYGHGYSKGLDHNLGYGTGIHPYYVSTEDYGNKWRGGARKRRSSSARVEWPSFEGTLSEYDPGRAKADYWSETVYPAFFKGGRHPEINSVLASDTTKVLYDVRVDPHIGIEPSIYGRYASAPATTRHSAHIRLISYDFPWMLDIDVRASAATAPRGSVYTSGYVCGYVTVGDVWATLFRALGEAISDAEWALLARDKKDKIEGALARRCAAGGVPADYARRVDWLGRNVMFRGLFSDDSFARDVLLPGRPPCSDTYLVKFEKARTSGRGFLNFIHV